MYSHKAKKSLGQHFIHDSRVINRIIDSLKLEAEDKVLEIGPGKGQLSRNILSAGAELTAIEIDRYLIDGPLKELSHEFKQFTLHEADAADVDPNEFMINDGPYKFVSNLPYNSATKILRNIMFQEHPPMLSVVMLQKEVADNIVSDGNLGILGPIFQSVAFCRRLFNVKRTAFKPVPKVTSTVIELKIREQPLIDLTNKNDFIDFIIKSFSAPRKQLHNSLSIGLDLDLESSRLLLQVSEVNHTLRPEKLSVTEWVRIFNEYKKTVGLNLLK